jgi:hypothetical protein
LEKVITGMEFVDAEQVRGETGSRQIVLGQCLLEKEFPDLSIIYGGMFLKGDNES